MVYSEMAVSRERVLPSEKLLFTVDQACAALCMGRTRFYEEVREKRLRVVKSGKRTLVTREEIHSYVSRLRGD